MKKMFVLWGALALLTAACSNEESQEVSFSPLVLTALQEGEATRTSLSGTEVHWSAGDNVAAFVSNVAHTSTATEILSAKSARFTFSDLAADAVVQYAVYPASAAVGLVGESVVTVTVPTEQTAVAGSFAEGSAVAIAKGGSSTLGFKNVCGFLAFTINADGVQSVHIYANEKMTGTADVNWNSGNPTVSAFKPFAYTGVKLTGPFTKGATYYAAVFPGNYTGLTLKLTHSNGYVSTYTNSNTLTISRKDNVVIARDLSLRTPTSGTWFEKAPATIGSDVPVIIVGKVGNDYRLISNADTGDSSPSAATTATVSGSTVTTDVAAEFKWNLSTTGGKFTLYPAGVNTRWLNCQTTKESGSQTCMAVSDDSNDSYFDRRFFIWDATGHLVTSDGYKDRYLSYNNDLWCGETFPTSTGYPAAVFSFYVQVP